MNLIFTACTCNIVTVQDYITLIVGDKTVNGCETTYLHRQQHSLRRKEAIQQKGQKVSLDHMQHNNVTFTFTVGFLRSHPVTLVQDYIKELIQKYLK